MRILETELNLLVPSPELLVRLASQDRPLGVTAGPPRIRFLRETYFDTPEHTLRSRGMTCKLRQAQGEEPSIVVTVGEGPDSEGITSRSRLTASSVGFGVFETLRGDSEMAAQIQKLLDPGDLRPQISLDIQRLGRLHRSGVFRRPTLFLYFDRINIQAGGASALLHEIRIRRRRPGGPLIRDLGQRLRDEFHLFPDGLTTLQRAYRTLAVEGKAPESGLSPYAMRLVLVPLRRGHLGLIQRKEGLTFPGFRGSGEDAARALLSDLAGSPDLELRRLGTTEPKADRLMMEVWVAPECDHLKEEGEGRNRLVWYPWHAVLELVGRGGMRDPDLLSALLLLTRRRLSGQLPWIPPFQMETQSLPKARGTAGFLQAGPEGIDDEVRAVDAVLPFLRTAERKTAPFETRMEAVREFTLGIRQVFNLQVRGLKERFLSREDPKAYSGLILLLDLLTVRIRGLVERLYQVTRQDLLPELEERGILLKSWTGLMREDRRVLLEEFQRAHLPSLRVVADWGPAFVPEMPPVGCALGMTAQIPGAPAPRFYHVVLADETPSFISVPGTSLVLPLEEVIRGFLFSRYPELERAETHLFRFRTAEVTVRKVVSLPIVTPAPAGATSDSPAEVPEAPSPSTPPVPGTTSQPSGETPAGGFTAATDAEPDPREPEGPAMPETMVQETVESVVIRVVVHPTMPEVQQAQLLRALERRVTRQSPLIGWGDLYAVDGPLDLKGLADLLVDEGEEPGR